MHPVTGRLNVEQCLRLLDDIDGLCRAIARETGSYSRHCVSWTTPAGSGIDGLPLYLVLTADGERWALGPNPDPSAPMWRSVADHLRTRWRCTRAVHAALDSTLPADYGEVAS